MAMQNNEDKGMECDKRMASLLVKMDNMYADT